MVDHYENLDESMNQMLVLDRICDEYEALAQRGEFPRLEDFIGNAHEETFRNQLLTELLPLEVEYRVRHGKTADLVRLEERFPLHVAIIRGARKEHHVADVNTERAAGYAEPSSQDFKRWYSIPGYYIDTHIAESHLGDVFAVRHIGTGKKLALKVLQREAVEQLEANNIHAKDINSALKFASRVSHPDVISHFEIKLDQQPPYYSMQLIDGTTLARLATPQPLEPRRAAGYLSHIASAIAAAHEVDVVHGCLTPDNILVQSGTDRALLSGLGISRFARRIPHDGERPEPVLPYLAPEVLIDPDSAQPPSDIYSIGAVLYHALTGRPPFQSPTGESLRQQIAKSKPLPPSMINSQIPYELEAIALRCLHKSPGKRFRSAADLSAAINTYIARQQDAPGSRQTSSRRLWRWMTRNKLAVVVMVILVAIIITLWLK